VIKFVNNNNIFLSKNNTSTFSPINTYNTCTAVAITTSMCTTNAYLTTIGNLKATYMDQPILLNS